MNSTLLTIDGMTCGHCVQAVTKALSAVDGVMDVDVNLGAGTATITAASEPSQATLRQVVNDAGYGVR